RRGQLLRRAARELAAHRAAPAHDRRGRRAAARRPRPRCPSARDRRMNEREVAQPAERIVPQAAPVPPPPAVARGLTPAAVLALQRPAGNAAVASLMRNHTHAETQPGPPIGKVRVVEFMPTITEPGVTYVIGRPDKRYTFEVEYAHKPAH